MSSFYFTPCTISTHLGGGTTKIDHNIRNPKVALKEDHINHERTHLNRILINKSIENAYDELFGESVKKYNAKQQEKGHPERAINNYLKKMMNDKKTHHEYEMIIGVYGDNISDETKVKIIERYFKEWDQNNPNLKLYNVVIHFDENSIHAHGSFIPVGEGYKNGMDKQASMDKALKCQGIEQPSPKRTRLIEWEAKENKRLESLCIRNGLIVEHPGKQKEHLETETYKALKQAQKAQEAAKTATDELNHLNNQIKALKGQIRGYKELQKYMESITFSNGKTAWEGFQDYIRMLRIKEQEENEMERVR